MNLEISSQARVYLACPACVTENRVPADRLTESPKCGKCGALLLDGTPVALSERNFDAFVRPPGLPVVVDFWAPWCGPCISMAPAFGEAARRLATVARFAKVNTEESSQLAQRFSIRSIPTLVLLRNGQEVKRISGAMDASSLIRWTNEERS